MNNIADKIRRIFIPKRCALCGRLIPFDENECLLCAIADYRTHEDFCIHCNKHRCICGNAHRLKLSVAFIYSGSIRSRIHRYKFGNEKLHADFFAKALHDSIIDDFDAYTFDYITFIPSNGKKLFGFNSSELISRRLARRLHCPCAPLLKRTRPTLKQHHLSYEKRITNMKDAFAVTETAELKGKTVLICDDVKTTGSTLKAAEEALLRGGAERVYCCAVATPVFAASDILDKESENL